MFASNSRVAISLETATTALKAFSMLQTKHLFRPATVESRQIAICFAKVTKQFMLVCVGIVNDKRYLIIAGVVDLASVLLGFVLFPKCGTYTVLSSR
jgi:hypothetical protein